jgi:hypothetical protein
VCGYKADSADIETLCGLLLETVPVNKKNSSLRLGGICSHLVSYCHEKVISDIAIENESEDSWLAVLGTPLISLKDKQSKQAFFDGFLTSPGEFLRHKIDGHFALFCYDSKRNRLLVATDFNNTTPIFYTVRANGVFFSSHELVLAKFANAEIDPLGFAQAMHLGVTWGTRTRFRNIFKMLPCQELIIDDSKQILTEYYWRPEEETMLSCDFDELVANWLPLLSDSVRKFFECGDYKPVASDLTGGEDTRLLVAGCHALGIPFKTQVVGFSDDSDVIVAKQAAIKTGIDLIVRNQQWISAEELLANAGTIILDRDAYQGFVTSCAEWAMKRDNPLDDYKIVVFCGNFGAGFRGTYYLRGKAIFPSRRSSLDFKFFTRLKYLLDYRPGLLTYPDDKFLDSVYGMVYESLAEVKGFPIGTQIDHLLRVFQSCLFGLNYKNPLHLPYATRDLTRSVYYIPPHYKQGSRLTRACTEILFPELAFVRTQKGIPTVRKTALRLPLFIPEYIHLIKSVTNGFASRFFKWKQPRALLSMQKNSYIFTTILNREPYCDWFLSKRSMVTGHLYNADVINSILAQARAGSCRNVPNLERIINLELACRWVYREGL